jgi:hypothetical protein
LPLDIPQFSYLFNKKWNCEKVIETRRGQVFELPTITSFTLSSDGKVHGYGASGQWNAVENKFLKFVIDKKKSSHKGRLVGAYSIYELSDSTLVLAQVLTSSGDWIKEYRFSIKESFSFPFDLLRSDSAVYDGERKIYNAEGKLVAIENYRLETGKVTRENFWQFNRYLQQINRMDSTFVKSVPIGEWKRFYPDGKLESVGNYDNYGNPVGEFI